MTKTNAITPAEAGITIKVLSGPRGKFENDWQGIEYTVELYHKDRVLWTGPYTLGIGHVKLPKQSGPTYAMGFSREEESMYESWVRKPHADFTDKLLQAQVAAKLAAKQKVTPKLDDVVHSLVSDGSAHFDSQSFEDWCGDFGYDTDSRKAEDTYRTCDEIGKKLMRALGRETIEGLREWASNY